MICSMYAKWVQSWRDLPILINQWANVVRWEKVTRPFLRTTEFLWQEGHTLHETEEEAEEETLKMLEVYRSFSEDVLAMPVVWGRKSESEKFAGALRTYAIEALMGDGKALQAGTSHNLGQHFATAYGIEYLDRDQKRTKPWSTSWGTSTRMVGGLIMTHGDDAGLILPPKVAPYQVVIVPIPPRKGGDWNEAILPRAREVAASLRDAGIRVHLDDREHFQTGYKYSDWEMRGVPYRLEIGPKDVAKEQCVLVRRTDRKKDFVPLAGVAAKLGELLDELQKDLLERAKTFREDNTARVSSYDDFKEVMRTKRGFLLAGWNGDPAVEAKIKEETKATVRVIPMDGGREAPCVVTGEKGREVYFAQAY
jgi:prolyl-tRNA synthetase